MIDGVEIMKGYMELCNISFEELRKYLKREDDRDIFNAFLEKDLELMTYIKRNGEKLRKLSNDKMLELLWHEWREELFLIFDEMMEYKKNE